MKKNKISYLIFFGVLIFLVIYPVKNLLFKKNYNIIIFTLDTTRYDYIDTGKGAYAETPNIRKIAEESIICNDAYTVSPITMPAHTSLFTGKYPYKNKVYNNGEKYLAENITLQEIFKKRGYKTGAVVSLGVLKREFGLSSFFDFYKDDFKKTGLPYFLPADIVSKRALNILKKVEKDKFFLWFHFSDPHEPYAPPVYKAPVNLIVNKKKKSEFNLYQFGKVSFDFEFKRGENIIEINVSDIPENINKEYPVRIENMKIVGQENEQIYNFNIKSCSKIPGFVFLQKNSEIMVYSSKKQEVKMSFAFKPCYKSLKTQKSLYKEEVEFMDKEIGKILDYLSKKELFKNTVIIFVGDHGEGLGEYRSHIGHIHYLRPQYIKIPFIIYFPDKKERIINKPVSINDIMPTLLKYFKLKEYKRNSFDGKNIFNVDNNRPIFSFTYRPESFFNGVSLIKNKKELIVYKGLSNFDEFIDLQKTNGYKLEDNTINNLKYFNIIDKMRKTVWRVFKISSRKKEREELSEKTKEILKSLGYL